MNFAAPSRVIALLSLTFFTLPVQAEVTVFAAASLRGALDEVNGNFAGDVTVSYASSAALARQIAQGAPADVFLSANPDWVRYLQEDPYVKTHDSAEILGNALLLVGSKTANATTLQDLPAHLEGRSLAIGLSTAVPAGIYARQALENLGLWAAVEPHLVQTDNVRAALALVSLGEVDYALLYRTDALTTGSVKVLDLVPTDSHQRISYVATRLTDEEAVVDYFQHIQAKPAQQAFAKKGFVPLAYINAQGGYD